MTATSSSSSSFQTPVKRLFTPEDLTAFQESQTHADVLGFIADLNMAILGVKLTDECHISPATEAVVAILARVKALAEATPPVDNALSRFGNPAFRTFYDKVSEASRELHASIPGLPAEAVDEVEAYFVAAWGNRERIDYGSGMELNFLCWMLCLKKLGVFTEQDYTALVTRVFWQYIQVMRYLQKTYWLEPAGSHGVWGLDDYHFLPFLWGAGQLSGHKHLRPKSIHDPEILEAFAPQYMYLSCIAFINSIKTASLRWHSPMLDDISAVKTWSKVNEGMTKMFKAEVLGKLPVAQHFLFGSLLPAPSHLPSDEMHAHGEGEEGKTVIHHAGHTHHVPSAGVGAVKTVGDVKGEMFGDCCGIPVPSAFAAGLQEKQLAQAHGLAAQEVLALARTGRPRTLPVD